MWRFCWAGTPATPDRGPSGQPSSTGVGVPAEKSIQSEGAKLKGGSGACQIPRSRFLEGTVAKLTLRSPNRVLPAVYVGAPAVIVVDSTDLMEALACDGPELIW